MTLERTEEFYPELQDSEPSTIIYTDSTEVPEITSWEAETALRYMKNGTTTGNDPTNIKPLKSGEDTNSKTFARLYTKYEYP